MRKKFWLIGLLLFGAIAAFAEEQIPFIDTHVHIMAMSDGMPPMFRMHNDPVGSAMQSMNEYGISKSILMPMPFTPNHPHLFDYLELAPLAKKNPERFAFMGGGGTLNPMIQEALSNPQVPESLREAFKRKAEEILQSGAIGFGEMAAEHISFHSGHPYEFAPPDHPLFLLLADIAAQHDVPIDLHMEAVTHDMPLPQRFDSPPNPPILHENIQEFERLLAHNPKARIIWAHAGWDNTGDRTVALMRRLLLAHPNLYMNIKIDPQSLPENRPLDENGLIRPEWLELIRQFPDRFFIGSDEFYGMPEGMRMGIERAKGPRIFLNQLPSDLARKVGAENAIRVYRLGGGQ